MRLLPRVVEDEEELAPRARGGELFVQPRLVGVGGRRRRTGGGARAAAAPPRASGRSTATRPLRRPRGRRGRGQRGGERGFPEAAHPRHHLARRRLALRRRLQRLRLQLVEDIRARAVAVGQRGHRAREARAEAPPRPRRRRRAAAARAGGGGEPPCPTLVFGGRGAIVGLADAEPLALVGRRGSVASLIAAATSSSVAESTFFEAPSSSDRDDLGERVRQLERRVGEVDAVLAEQVARARVGVVEHAAVELREEARRRRKLVRVARRAAHQRDADDGHALLDRRDQLEQAVRPLQHRRRLHEHDATRLGDVLLRRVRSRRRRVEEALLAQALRELALQVARLEERVRRRVRDERGVLGPLAPKHVPRGLFARGAGASSSRRRRG